MATAATLTFTPAAPAAGQSTFRLLLRTMGHLRRSIGPFFATHGISHSQWTILWTLHLGEENNQSSSRLTDLGDRLFVRPPTITSAVDRLVRSGHVQRVSGSQDGREKHVRLTPAGRRLVRELHELHAQKVEALLAVLTLPEQKRLNALLLKLATENQPGDITEQDNGHSVIGRNGKRTPKGRDA